MEHYKFFPNTNVDGKYCKRSFRKVINALRLSYSNKTPPTIIDPTKKSDPFDLIQNHPKFKWINSSSQLFLQVKFIINGIFQFRDTRDPNLIKQIRKRVFENKYVSIETVRQLILNMFKYCEAKWVPYFFGVNLYSVCLLYII